MTKGKSWWFEKTAFNEVFINVETTNGSERLSHNQGRHRPYSSVKGSCLYDKNPKLVKVIIIIFPLLSINYMLYLAPKWIFG